MSKPIEGCPQPETEIRDRVYTDRQLLELAAKAAGITLCPAEVKNIDHKGRDSWIGYMTNSAEWPKGWFNPLTDDGDAFRLAMALRINIEHMFTQGNQPRGTNCWPVGRGDCASVNTDLAEYIGGTRRAIVRAAAAIAEGGVK